VDLEPVYTMRGHSGAVLSLAMSPTGEFCYSGGIDGAICCWNVPNICIDPYDAYGKLLQQSSRICYYLRQVNEVNGGGNVFVRCVCVCLSVRSGRSWELNANSSKTVKAMDFKFDTRVPRDSLDMTPKIFPKGGMARVT